MSLLKVSWSALEVVGFMRRQYVNPELLFRLTVLRVGCIGVHHGQDEWKTHEGDRLSGLYRYLGPGMVDLYGRRVYTGAFSIGT